MIDAQKGAILVLILVHIYAEIEVQLDILHSTITNFVLHTEKHNSIENLSQSGRPQNLSNTSIRYFVCTAEANSHIPFKELKNLADIDVSI